MATDRVAFDLVRSPYFRVVHADGAVGAPTPRGLIQFCLYSERHAIPDRVVQSVLPDGTLTDVIEESRPAAVTRELDVSVIMDLSAASAFHAWLGEQIVRAGR